MIKNLVFDFGGVVVPLDPEQAWRRFESLGIKNVRQQMGAFGQTGIFRQVETGEISAAEFLKRFAEQAQEQSDYFGGREPSFTFEQVQWAWRGYVKEVAPERLGNLLRLKQDYRVLLLSNTNPFLMEWADSADFSGDGHPIGHYFHKVYYSYRMHDYKPSQSIFRQLVADAGIEPAETVFLDDGPRNVEAAAAVGLRAILVPGNADWMPLLKRALDAGA